MEDDELQLPVDIDSMLSDDALLDGLGCGAFPADGDELAMVLSLWRREMHSKPMGEIMDVAAAAAMVRSARRWRAWDRFIFWFEYFIYAGVALIMLSMAVGL